MESIQDRIERVRLDLGEIKDFYKVRFSPTRYERLQKFYNDELSSLDKAPFEDYDQEGKIDFLLLKSYLRLKLRQLKQDAEKDDKVLEYLGGHFPLRAAVLISARQAVGPMDGKATATLLTELSGHIVSTKDRIVKEVLVAEPTTALRAANGLTELLSQLQEWYAFYAEYDPLFTWWVAAPWPKVEDALADLVKTIKTVVLGLDPLDEDKIIGEPIGQDGLLDALESEMIPYTPEELIEIAKKEYAWCENEMQKAAAAMGHADWRAALEEVKNEYVPPGQQPQLVRSLTMEATEYVKKYDLVTVPPIAEETWQTFMMTPAAQKMNPFFLGGDCIIVSYPTSGMSHADKLMSLRGNNIHFARATVFHEMIPGHHLHAHYWLRHRAYRYLFETPFCIEGWAFYWEMVLWDAPSWTKTPQNRIGMLFWRMHRCARIVFSLKYHLGEMTPEECVELLVDWVGHERATAEGEVRRSIMGDYGPLYQAGYMLGALQLYRLRKEVVVEGGMGEKAFHDKFLRSNMMPVELFRALVKDQELDKDFKTKWRFYDS
ncbi:hypothetical protein K504DRAFT_379934 [Pleomassaria siparia CBS 279.74]|uniref:X-Pro dipeptidyl-peptidase n=1 Tax=Pleomassaria siparia CBS 279.74 TaxID=1314801 RepID=A0A6G1KAN7_9PLEO|nr:hypothetical protein K504DRAFT_379934 [Pleomassaria siparia CBS 279.74]